MWLNISGNTLDWWLKREEKTGDYRAITNYQQGGGTKSWTGRDLVSFPESMEVTRKQKGLSLWGDKVTQQNLSDALAKIRWSGKKRVCHFEVPWKCKAHSTQTYGYREGDELKRQAFQQRWKSKSQGQMV